MRTLKNGLEPDLRFDYNGETIQCRVVDDKSPIRMVKGVEKWRGLLDFYDANGEYIDTVAFYENYEDMTPISFEIAEKYYEEILARNKK